MKTLLEEITIIRWISGRAIVVDFESEREATKSNNNIEDTQQKVK